MAWKFWKTGFSFLLALDDYNYTSKIFATVKLQCKMKNDFPYTGM